MSWLHNLFFPKKFNKQEEIDKYPKGQIFVTLDWSANPITTLGDGYILPRSVEMRLNKKYYPNNVVGEWPYDPLTGNKLPIEPNEYNFK